MEKVFWTDPDGKIVNTTLEYIQDDRLVSTIVVNITTFQGQYKCMIIYPGGSDSKDYAVSGFYQYHAYVYTTAHAVTFCLVSIS